MTNVDLVADAEVSVEDDAESDEIVPLVSYDITSYGADPDVEGLVRRLKRSEILIPPFQRDYVWKQPEASRFIESLLLGLPVPGVFFATQSGTNKLLVIDGQQRLKSLQFFYDGFFNPKVGDKKQKVFDLIDVQPQFVGRTHATLDEPDRIRLDNSIIHATIVKQEAPPNNDTSIYHIFERLNSAGRVLAPQEIRSALYHGTFADAIRELNDLAEWRSIFGKLHSRLKDRELILRFLALYMRADKYERPMEEFLNKFMAKHQNADDAFLERVREAFSRTVRAFWRALGREAFRPGKTLNAAVFDSAMVGLATRLATDEAISDAEVRDRYRGLIADSEYFAATSRSTSDDAFVKLRLTKAIAAFAQS